MNSDYIRNLFSLDGKKAVVTGAGSGLGQAIACSLANFGAEVTIAGRTGKGLDETESRILQAGGSCKKAILDISDTDAQKAFFSSFAEREGHLDIFVANAGIGIRAEIPDTTLEDMDAMIRNNYVGTMYGLIQASGIMKKQRSGNIVVISSINGISPLVNQAVYSSLKAALESAVRSLAGSLAEYGVRVNSCAPGCILTGTNKHIFCHDDLRQAKEACIPLGRLGNPPDIGDVVACMVSDAFRFVTGTTVAVDGGELIRPKMKQTK